MKIGIIGLQPRQIADVRKRTFNGHEVEFYDEKTYSQEKVASFVRKMDKLVLLPGHAPKRVSEWIPKTKLLQTMAGGISSVVRLLETIPADASPEPLAPLRVNRPEPKLPEERPAPVDLPPPAVTIKPPKKLGQTIPQGRKSLYEWSPDQEIVHPNESGEHRYDLLDAAVPGDLVRMARPHGLDYQKWRTRVTATRYNREKTKGQILEAHYFEEYVDLLVVETKEEGVWQKDEVEQTPSGRGEAIAAMGVTIVEESPVPVSKEPVQETSDVSAPAPSLSELLVIADKVERSFWENAVLVSIGRGLSATDAAAMADQCVREQRLRFTGEK